jgi:hypothetical protein
MMRVGCFCGRHGLLIDRIPVYAGDGEWGLECPDCGNLERLTFLSPEERHEWLLQAAERQIEPQEDRWPDPLRPDSVPLTGRVRATACPSRAVGECCARPVPGLRYGSLRRHLSSLASKAAYSG